MVNQARFSNDVVSLACLLILSATACSAGAEQQLPNTTPASQGIDGAVLQRTVTANEYGKQNEDERSHGISGGWLGGEWQSD